MNDIIIKPELKKTFSWKMVVIFILFSAAIILMGTYYSNSQRKRIFKEQENNLSAIASLKISQIENWHKERLGDATVISHEKPIIISIEHFFSGEDIAKKTELYDWMKSVRNEYDYSNVLIADTSLKVRLSVNPSDSVFGKAIKMEMKSAIQEHKVTMTDLHRSKEIPWIHIDILIPLYDSVKNKLLPVGIAVLRIDPEKVLFPLIQSWPTSSKSSETLLLRKEGDSVLFLNELRHRKNTALNLKLPLNSKSLLASKVVNGFKGVTEGVDYRNIPVIGALNKIPDLPWYMVAKTDKDEILGPFKRYSINAAIVIVLLILINGFVFGIWIWNQQVRMYRLQLKDEIAFRESKEKLYESEELFRKLFDNMLNGFAYCKMISEDGQSPDFLYINVNEAFTKLTGLKDVIGKKVSEAVPGIQEADPELLERYKRVSSTGIPEVFETYVESLKMWFAISVYSPQKGYFVSVFDVITARKFAENALRENEKRLHEAQEMAHLGFWLWDIKTGDVEWSEEVYKIFCLDPETFTPKIDSILELSPWPKDNQRDKELIKRAMETHNPGDYEQKFLRPDKSIGYYYSTFRGNYDDSGELISIVGTVLDITERKNAELALLDSEERFRSLYENVTIGIYRTTAEGQILLANPALVSMLGFNSFEQLANRNLEHEGYEPDYPRSKFLEKIEKEGKIIGLESAWNKRSGDVLYVRESAKAVRDARGKMLYYDGTVEDITDRKKVEEALRESEDKFKYVFDHSVAGKSITFPSGEIHVNKAFCDMTGYSSEELGNTKWQDISYPEDIKLTENELQSLISDKKKSTRFIKRYIHKKGDIVWADVGTALRRDENGKPLYFMTTAIDITERKLAEKALSESEERFSKSFRTSPISFMIANMDDGRIIEVNDAFTNISGFTRQETLNSTTLDLKIWVREEDRKHMLSSLRDGNPVLHKETLLRGKNGNISTVLLSAQVIKLVNRNCIISSIEDITKRKEVEAELRVQSEIMSHMAEAVYLVGMEDGMIVFTNSRFEELFGYGSGEMIGKPVSIVNAPTEKSPETTAKEIMNVLEKEGLWTGEVLNIRKDGTVFWSHANVTIFDHSKFGKVLVSVQEDITDRKNAEFQIKKLNEELEGRVIQRTEMLEAANKELEAFSYSVSHDLRAPLRAVHGYSKILLEDYEDKLDDEGRRVCNIISSSAMQMGGLIDDLLSFSRIGRSHLNPGVINMKSQAESLFTELSNETEKAKIHLEIGKLHKAYGDQSLIKHVWNNLISNALKYTSKQPNPEVTIGSKKEGEMVTYFVKDNGVGFDMQYSHKLFGVFQRLHNESEFEGNGVGLAIVQRIVLRHGGKVWAEGEVGKGATFYFSLPADDKGQKTKV
ncbi:MAG: PAS domain S-box protein [Bacteroidales bacterium]